MSLDFAAILQRLFLLGAIRVENLLLKEPVRQIRLHNPAEFTAVIAQSHVASLPRLLRRHLIVHIALVLVQRFLYLVRETLLRLASGHLADGVHELRISIKCAAGQVVMV